MYIECLIERVGATTVILGNTKYTFMPVLDPKRKKDEPSTSICDINSEEHIEHFLKSKQFRKYVEGQPNPEKKKELDLSGFAIVKHQEGRLEGYRIENNNVKPKMYAGSGGEWKEKVTDINPFATEFAAYTWLKDEINMSEPKDKSSKGKKEKDK